MLSDLKDKVAVVTGGSRGIGRKIVTSLAHYGADSVFTYVKNKESAEKVVHEVEEMGRKAVPLQLDVKDFESCKKAAQTVKDVFGRIDMLVSNAGITQDKALMLMEKEDWDNVIDTNLTGAFNITRALIVTFMKQRRGNIVYISSLCGIRPSARQVNYVSSKAGLIGFAKALALEVANYNIRVNTIAPGFTVTDMLNPLGEKYKDELLKKVPLQRFARPEDIANAVLFLLSDASQYITGNVIQVDGGLSI